MNGLAKHRIAYGLKCALAYGLYGTGLLWLWKKLVLRGRAVVLLYHRVLPRDAMAQTWSHPAIVVANDTFERQMRIVSRALRPMDARDFLERLEARRPFESGSCLVTFDDGWIDTCSEAWPVMGRYNVPALVFLPTRFVGSTARFWQERLSALVYDAWEEANRSPDRRPQIAAVLGQYGLERVLDCNPAAVRRRVLDSVSALKRERVDPEAIMAEISALLPDRPDGHPSLDTFMTWEDVRRMAAEGVSFGAHSHTHRLLTTLPEPELGDEVRVSRARMSEELGGEVPTFSYPNGNWNGGVVEAVRRGGFRVAFTTDRGTVGAGADLFTVRRINIHEDMTRHTPMFLARLLGVL